ncbi:DUF503 domain-containing protein [Proteiniclasticum sp.]|uniref:DUF503 domain-containing protein n=1 Tax=Proteiniclasticum sp. TaxID=2053595 RepID=UPI00289D4D0C|nr:DUF503 domain-containing protein [Proteiniclasticum sp.]
MIYVAAARMNFRVSYVHSLKEKRSIVNSIKAKVKNRFNVSVIEAEELDNHKSIVLGLSAVSSSKDIAAETIKKVADFILSNFDIELIQEETYIDNM